MQRDGALTPCSLCAVPVGAGHAVAVDGVLVEVCTICYFCTELRSQLSTRPLDNSERAEVNTVLRLALAGIISIVRRG